MIHNKNVKFMLFISYYFKVIYHYFIITFLIFTSFPIVTFTIHNPLGKDDTFMISSLPIVCISEITWPLIFMNCILAGLFSDKFICSNSFAGLGNTFIVLKELTFIS